MAQTTPDAGALRQQIEQGQAVTLPELKRPQVAPAPVENPQGAVQLSVKAYQFEGRTLVDEIVLMEAVRPWLNRPVDFSELEKAATAVATAYRNAGWVVRAFLPRQEINHGVVTIRIVEAVFGNVDIRKAEGLVLKSDLPRTYFLAAQPMGHPLNADAVDRALLLIDDIPGVAAVGNMVAGQTEQQTNVIVDLSAKPQWERNLTLDSTGGKSTGEYRLGGSINANNTLGWGEQFSANAVLSEGSVYLRGAALLPVGDQGWRAGINASVMDYRIVTDSFSAMDLNGRSTTYGVEGTYPLLRSRERNLYVNTSLEKKKYFNDSANGVTSDYAIDNAVIGLSGNAWDSVGGGGTNSASLSLVLGRVDLNGSPNKAADAAGPDTAGGFQKIRYAVARQQMLSPLLSAFAGLTGQWAGSNLNSAEQFYLGGSGAVRAYPSSEAGGAAGNVLTAELRYRLPENLVLTGFYDAGQVTVNPDNDFVGGAKKNHLFLHGVGLGLAWALQPTYSAKITWARRIGNNPNPAANGNDNDGTKDLNRFWLQASMNF